MKNKNQILDDALSSDERVQFDKILLERRVENRIFSFFTLGFILAFVIFKYCDFQLENRKELTDCLGGAALALSAWGSTVFLARIAKPND